LTLSTTIVEPLIDVVAPSINNWSDVWKVLPIIDGMSGPTVNLLHRLNGLGSFYYFTKIILRKHRLVEHLHKPICDSLEKDSLRELLEIPRDHFKSTICSEAYPMWRALPFSHNDEQYMRCLGYGDEWIAWMHYVHNQDQRNLLVSANIKNAAKLGRRIDFHYFNNGLFRGLFPEIIPDKSDVWAVESMTHKRSKTAKSGAGEGTYDSLGVGAALQSRHYDLIVEDDLVGMEALDSELVMQSIIDYHKLVVGAFDSIPGRPDLIGDEIIVGNRWQYEDLNSYLREFEPEFNIQSHDAEGGCCALHPPATPIFPEEFSWAKLKKIENRLKTYFYSCQYRNKPTPPGEERFKENWLRWFNYARFIDRTSEATIVTSDNRLLDKSGTHYKIKIVHDVRQGEVIKDILPTWLDRGMIVDPAHEGVNGRSRHCVVVFGTLPNTNRIYLLEVWAKSDSFEELINMIYMLGEKWKVKRPYCEGVAFQKFLAFHFAALKKIREKEGKWTFDRVDTDTLKTDRSPDGKKKRIEAMEPIYKRGDFWACKIGMDNFLEEYRKYPYSKYKDILDTLGYLLQVAKPGRAQRTEVEAWLRKNASYREGQINSVTGY
jgi:hypothetical protein